MGKEMSKILPGLYLGKLDNAQNDNDMMANCITHVCSVHEPVKQKLQRLRSYEYYEVNVKDEENTCISKYFSKTNDFIHEARMRNGNVLIHCLAGVSRAPTIVLAYLITVYGLSFQDAYNCLRAVRPNIKPNAGFIKQLNDFENTDASYERSRLADTFGIYSNLEEDKKLIDELITQYVNRENDNYYIDNSLDSNSDPTNYLHCEVFDDDNGAKRDVLPDNDGDMPLPLSNISHQTPSPTPERQSDFEDEVDIPGSIPIGMPMRHALVPSLGTSSSDYRGRAHSRQSHAISATVDSDPIFNRYGQTAPPSLPLFFNNSD